MQGDGLGINTQSILQTGYLVPAKNNTKQVKANEDFAELIKKLRISEKYDGYQMVVDKDGVVRKGKIVKNEPQTITDIMNGKEPKELAKVKKEQVTKFLEEIKILGLDLKAEDIMSKNGTLNPNFKVDENGNISFRNLKSYINENGPKYFETQAGTWAQAEPEQKTFPKEGILADVPKFPTNPWFVGSSKNYEDTRIKLPDPKDFIKLA